QLQQNGIDNRPELYVDRGYAYLKIGQYDTALSDFEKALSSEKLSSSDMIRAVDHRVTAYLLSKKFDEYFKEYKRYIELCQDRPIIEHFKDRIIIRNVPDDKAYHSWITYLWIGTGLIENEDSIKKYPSSKIWIAKKKLQQSSLEETEIENPNQPIDF